MDLSRNIHMDLLYLTNGRMRVRMENLENSVNKEDLKFYRKRILQETKNICDKSSLSIISMPKITDADGIKATNNMAMRGLSCNCIIYPIRISVMNIRPAIEFISH